MLMLAMMGSVNVGFDALVTPPPADVI